MAYLVSARKYRPASFKDMVGQEHISSTLQNAIRTGQLAHSFLFCGPRGVGKTTAARILAKTINCENVTAETEACNVCPSCVAFNQNSSFNIHELDAASNNSVEDIRLLVDQVRFPPQSGKFKIYIIDEVHMLSAAAFNAFLKTLEEPPSYCKFILATTEKHKILPTILSRCQIFDFRRMSIETVVNHLKHICELEHIEAEEDALHIIAQKCDGGMRDALSMFDRLSSFSGGKLTYASVLENLNVLDYDYFFKVTDALLAEAVPTLMQSLDEVLRRGFEGDDFILGLCNHFRQLIFCKTPETVSLMETSENLKMRYAAQAELAPNDFLINCLSIGNQCDIQYKQSKNKRLTVELALIKMCYVNATIEASQEASKKKVVEPAAIVVKEAEKMTADTSVAVSRPVNAPPRPVADKDAAVKKGPKLLSFDQLKDIHDKKTSGNDQKNADDLISLSDRIRPFDQENILMLWEEFSQNIKETKGGLFALMQLFQPVLESNTISIQVSSITQEQQFHAVKTSLLNFIYSNTGVRAELQVGVNKTEVNSGPKYFSPQDKMKRLIEVNPAIRKLVKDLGLDIDYN
ncbi:MAG: DNA polymerase III subunit gamma/tau [Chitinophagales bacterium]